MGIVESAETWLFSVALKKVVKRAIPWVTSIVAGPALAGKINGAAAAWGVQVTVDPMAFSTAFGSALALFQNWVKVRTGWSWL